MLGLFIIPAPLSNNSANKNTPKAPPPPPLLGFSPLVSPFSSVGEAGVRLLKLLVCVPIASVVIVEELHHANMRKMSTLYYENFRSLKVRGFTYE